VRGWETRSLRDNNCWQDQAASRRDGSCGGVGEGFGQQSSGRERATTGQGRSVRNKGTGKGGTYLLEEQLPLVHGGGRGAGLGRGLIPVRGVLLVSG
jgi:hypothetical protein